MKLRTLLIITAITTPIMIAIMWLHGAPLKSLVTPMGILNLEFAGTVSRATEIYAAWKPSLIHVAIKNTIIDFLFLVSYGCLLYACCLLLSQFYIRTMWGKMGWWASRLVVTASVFDAVENVLMFRTLSGNIYKEIVASTCMFAAAKFSFVIIAILYILLSLAALPFRKQRLKDDELSAQDF